MIFHRARDHFVTGPSRVGINEAKSSGITTSTGTDRGIQRWNMLLVPCFLSKLVFVSKDEL